MTDAERCATLRHLDREYGTDPESPLHHDNRRCPVHGDGRDRDDYGPPRSHPAWGLV